MREYHLPYVESNDAFDAVVVLPEGRGPYPLILVCHAWGGRGPLEEEKARQLAEFGYAAAAIDLYGLGKRGRDKTSAERLMTSLVTEPELLRRRLRASFDAATTIDGVDPNRFGAIGFCFGGLCAILMARMGLPLTGVVSFHGLLKLGVPLDSSVNARILVLHGQDDPMVPASDIAAFADEMKRIHADWQLHVYPHTMHAFTNPAANDPAFGTVYNQASDQRAWKAMRRFFDDLF